MDRCKNCGTKLMSSGCHQDNDYTILCGKPEPVTKGRKG